MTKPGHPRIAVIGHRGAMGHAPENTLASFKKAIEIGVDFVEMDIHLTSDGVPVVIHDHTLDRTTNGHGLVGQTPLEQVRSLDAGSWFDPAFASERVPTLEEVLRLTSGECGVVLEIKNGPMHYPGIEKKVIDALHRSDMTGAALAISFDHPTVLRISGLDPSVRTGVLFVCQPVDVVGMARGANARVLLPQWSYLTGDMVETARKAGLEMMPWVVDDPNVMQTLIWLRVDAITSNYPDRLKHVLTES